MTAFQSMVDYMVVGMAALLAAFVVFLVVSHIVSGVRLRRFTHLRAEVLRVVSARERMRQIRSQLQSLISDEGEITSLSQIRGIRSQRGVQVMDELAAELGARELSILREAANDAWFRVYLRGILRGDDVDFMMLAVKLIGELTLPAFADDMIAVMYRCRNNPDARQLGLLALALLGDGDDIVAVCADPGFPQDLSFRGLQEIFAAYGGNKRELYERLLDTASDRYIHRTCIKRIGADRIGELAPRVAEYLDSSQRNLVIDAVRTLGQLAYAPAGDTLALMSCSASWEVRSVVITSLASINAESYHDIIVRGLYDSEWWVRYHAAEALVPYSDRAELLECVRLSGDRFANEILNFAIARSELGKGAAS